MDTALVQQQQTQLSMTNELKQAIEMLEYSFIDIKKFIEEKAMSNPFIKLTDSKRIDSSPTYVEAYTSETNFQPIDNYAKSISLKEHLHEQLLYSTLCAEEKSHISYLIEHVNDRGFLNITIEDFISERQINNLVAEACLRELQSFEPVGVGARSIQESLLLQLAAVPRSEIAMHIIQTDFEALTRLNMRKLAKDYNLNLSEVQEVIDLIRTLNPYPGTEYASTQSEFIEPDAAIITDDEGAITIQVNDAILGLLQTNHHYEALLKKDDHPDHFKYAKEKIQEIDWLYYSLTRRQETMYAVIKTIAESQKSFLTEKHTTLAPLTLKDVAIKLDIHESTVSRATANKYVQTSKGLIELRSLFSSKHNSHSKEALKSKLKEFIRLEDERSPLSDQELVVKFEMIDISLSRRAISKYRAELKIPSSTKRKRYQ